MSCSTQLSMLVEAPGTCNAQLAVDRFGQNMKTWNSLISDYLYNGKLQHALDLYLTTQNHDSINPDGPTFVSLLKACGKLKDPKVGYVIHAEVSRTGLLQKNIYIGSALVDMYAKCGCVKTAKQVFDKLPVRDVVLWTSLIAGYIEHGKSEEAIKVFEQMQLNGISPNAVTFICCLKACGDIGAIKKGREIHAEVSRQGLNKRDNAVGNCVVSMYAKCGALGMAHEAIKDIETRDVISWTALITGNVEHGYDAEALECFDQMMLEGIEPNIIAFVYCLKACGNIQCREKGQQLHEEVKRLDLLMSTSIIGSMLVDMYVQCSHITKAKEVLDTLPIKVLESWNALIRCYSDQGLGNETLDCLQRMLCESVNPDSVTFIYSLRACCATGAMRKAREVHLQVIYENRMEDPVIGNILIDAYARHGLLCLAQQVFDKLLMQDLDSWTALIAGYADYGHDKQAFRRLNQMMLLGAAPSVPTYVCCLKVCGKIGAIDKGEVIHADVEKRGLLESHIDIGNALVNMYAKCQMLKASHHVFDRLLDRDIISWTLLIQGYAECGQCGKILECMELMQIEGFSPNAFTYACSLKTCDCTEILWKLHADVEKQGFLDTDLAISNMLISIYAHIGSLTTAQQLFDRIPVQNVVSWTTIMKGLAAQGMDESVLEYFQLMQLSGVHPDTVTFITILKTCGNLGVANKGQEIHAEVERKRLLQTNLAIGNIVVNMYIQCGLLSKALQVFEKLPVRNEVSWNTLISCYTDHGYATEAIKCFEAMLREGIFPSNVSFVYLMKAKCTIGTNLQAQDMHAQIEELISETDICVENCMIHLYGKCGLMSEAAEIFDTLKARDIISWNSIITACGIHDHANKALKYFEEMTFEGMPPDVITFVCILKACGNIGTGKKGQKVHADIERLGLLGCHHIGSALVTMYAKCGLLSEAWGVFDKLLTRDIITWTAILFGHAQLGECEHVFYNFGRMLNEGVEPDSIVFVVVLTACSHAYVLHKCQTYMEDMSTKYGMIPAHEHYGCLINMLAHAGRLDDAVLTAKKMPFSPTPSFSHTLLDACKNCGNAGIGQHAFKSATYFDGEDAVAYVLLSQICADGYA